MAKIEEVALVELSEDASTGEKPRTRRTSSIGAFLRVVFLCLLLTGSLAVFVCWHFSTKDSRSKIMLEDVLTSSKQPQLGNTIFFHKRNPFIGSEVPEFRVFKTLVKHPEVLRLHFTPQEACAIESAALHNPDQQVFVLYESPVAWIRNSKYGLMATLRNISNVNLRSVDLGRYMADTPFEYLAKPAQAPTYTLSRISDFFGFLSVFHYGGTCLSMDSITLRNFDDLGSNFAVIDKETEELTTKIFNFAPLGSGHHAVMNLCRFIVKYLRKMGFGYDIQSSEALGRKLLTGVFQRKCKRKDLDKVQSRQSCYGLRAYGQTEFYGLPSNLNASQYENLYAILDEYKQSLYGTYNWAHFNGYNESERIFSGPYALLAKQNCPKTYACVQLYEGFLYGAEMSSSTASNL